MLNLNKQIPIYLCTQPTDMRKSFNGLMGIVENDMALNPLSGYLFVFRNRIGDKLKVLYWDADGLAIWYKRLEKGTFQWLNTSPPGAQNVSGANPSIKIDAAQFNLLLEGIDLQKIHHRPRYGR